MDNFDEYVQFWLAAALVFYVCKFGEEIGKDLRAKYIVWAWKRRK